MTDFPCAPLDTLPDATTREVIRRFHAEITREYQRLTVTIEQTTPTPGWNQCGETPDDERRRQQAELAVDRLHAQRDQLAKMWQLVKTIYGETAVDAALDEGRQQIGTLPYVR